MADDGAVRVALRIRPLLPKEHVEGAAVCIRPTHNGSNQVIMGEDRPFTFDAVFPSESPQQPVYEEVVVPLVDACFKGYNATVLAYGQTGSGKTYTMGSGSLAGTSEEQVGIIPRVITSMFNQMQSIREQVVGAEFKVKVQFIEIYGEAIRDLLDPAPDGRALPIREVEDGTVQLVGVTTEEVPSAHHLMQSLERGSLARTTASTMMNAHSSRSHAIFTVILEQNLPETNEEDGTGAGAGAGAGSGAGAGAGAGTGEDQDSARETVTEKRTSKFHFVDLAGSERAKRTQAVGQRLKEGIHINKGLLALGNVISALGDVRKRGKVHVPYRDSKLTRMLQDSLGGNSKTLMVACVSPADTNFDETLNTLKYANRARNIKNKPIVNRDRNASQVATLKREIAKLKQQIAGGPAEEYERLRRRCRTADDDVRRLNSATKDLRRQLDRRTEEKLAMEAKFTKLRMLYKEATGQEAPVVEDVPRDVAAAVAAANIDPATIKLDDEASRDVSAGVPIDAVRKYLAQIQALRDKVSSTEAELAQAKAVIHEGGMDMDEEEEERFVAATGDWLNAQQADTTASLDDIITRLSFGSHNSPLVKMARANLARRRSPAARKVTARIIAETKEAAEEGVTDTEVAIATGEALAEVEVQFEKKHGEMVKTMQTLSDDIKLKESAMARQSKMFVSMKKLYESKMAAMNQQMQRTMAQRDKLLSDIQNIGSSVEAEKKRLKARLVAKLRSTEKQLESLKRKQREFEKLKRLQARAKQRLREVQQELHAMKRMRVSQQRALEAAKKEFRSKVLLKSREILSLRREANKERNLLRKLQNKEAKRDMVLKRRMEDLTAQNRRLKEAQKRNRRINEAAKRTAAVARAARGNASRRRRPRRETKTTREVRRKLEEAIREVALKEEKNEELRKKLHARDRDLRMMEELLEQRRALVSDLDLGDTNGNLDDDIHAFFGAAGAPSGDDQQAAAAAAAAGSGTTDKGTDMLSVTADIQAYFAAPAAGAGAGAGAGAAGAPGTPAVAAPKAGTPEELAKILVAPASGTSTASHKRRAITIAEAEALEELEERIEGTEARLRYTAAQIQKQLGGGDAGEVQDAGGDTAEGVTDENGEEGVEAEEHESIARVATLDEAKGIMRELFAMVVGAKQHERTKQSEVDNLKLKLEEVKQELDGACNSMRLLKQQHERQLAKQEAEHAQEQAMLMSVAAAADEDGDSDAGEEEDEQHDERAAALQQRNVELQSLLERSQAELKAAKRELAAAVRRLSAASAEDEGAAPANVATTKGRRKQRGSHGRRSAGRSSSSSRRQSDDSTATGARGSTESAGSSAADDLWQAENAAAQARNNKSAKSGTKTNNKASKKPARVRKGGRSAVSRGSRRSQRVRRLGASGSASQRWSLGGRLTAQRRPRTAPSSNRGSTGASSARGGEGAASTSAGAEGEEVFGTTDISKPLPQMNVFNRLSDYRTFTGTHRATHATIALGRNEYHNADNNMFRRAKPKKAWSSSLRSSDDGAAGGSTGGRRSTSRTGGSASASGDKAVFGRLADVRNYTGVHRHKHEELKAKASTKKGHAGLSASGSSASHVAAAAPATVSPGSGDGGSAASSSTPDTSPIRLPRKAGVRKDSLGTRRLVDAVPLPSDEHGDADDGVGRLAPASMSPHVMDDASDSPFVLRQELSTLVEEDGEVNASTVLDPEDDPREAVVQPTAAPEDAFANIDLTGLEVEPGVEQAPALPRRLFDGEAVNDADQDRAARLGGKAVKRDLSLALAEVEASGKENEAAMA